MTLHSIRFACWLAAMIAFTPLASGGTDQVRPVFGSGTGTLTGVERFTLGGSGTISTGFNVRNDGDATQFSVLLEDDPDAAFSSIFQPTDLPIGSGEFVDPGFTTEFDRSAASGVHTLLATLRSPGDDDNNVLFTMNHYDPAALVTSPDPLDASQNNGQFFLENLPADAGGLRAAAEITNTSVSSGFAVTGLSNGTLIEPGSSVVGQVAFDPRGSLVGDKSGSLTLFSRARGDGQSLGFNPRFNAAMTANVPLRESAIVDVAAGEDFAANAELGLNGLNTAVTVAGGTSTASQQVSMSFVEDPATGLRGAQPQLLSDVARIQFSELGDDLYILEMTYNPLLLPEDVNELDLRLFAFDGADWVNATSLNSDGGDGGELFFTSVESYLNLVGGGAGFGGGVDGGPRLGDRGVDRFNGRVWAVLEDFEILDDEDFEDVFSVAEERRLFLADFDGDGDVDGEDFLVWQANFPRLSGAIVQIGDADEDGDVDGDDFLIWQLEFGSKSGQGAAAAAVPEPSTWIATLAILATGTGLSRKCQKRPLGSIW